MRYRFDECLERGKIVRIPVDPALAAKELREAEADLAAAERSIEEHREKWAIIQGYFSLFHALRSQVFLRGYREKSHRCLKYESKNFVLLLLQVLMDSQHRRGPAR